MENNKKITSWVLAGLATGAATWYLFGTKSGKELLSNLMSSAKDVITVGVKEKFSDFSNKASDIANRVRSRSTQVY